jgi:hypothetical protein
LLLNVVEFLEELLLSWGITLLGGSWKILDFFPELFGLNFILLEDVFLLNLILLNPSFF